MRDFRAPYRPPISRLDEITQSKQRKRLVESARNKEEIFGSDLSIRGTGDYSHVILPTSPLEQPAYYTCTCGYTSTGKDCCPKCGRRTVQSHIMD